MARGVKGTKGATKTKVADKGKDQTSNGKAAVNSAAWYGRIIKGLLAKAAAAGHSAADVMATAK